MEWQQLPERSNPFWIRCIISITRLVGRSFSGLLLYPISLYFLIINNKTRAASRRYLKHALGKDPTFGDHFRQYHTFACSLLDRLSILLENDAGITFRAIGLEHLERVRDSGTGAILVGSHLGGFDLLRMIGRNRAGYRVKAVMFGDATPQIIKIFQELNPSLHEDIITVPGVSAILGLLPDIQNGLLIGLLGDRIMSGERRMECPFFGEMALFPTTAPYLADILEVPLLQFFCLQEGWGQYEVVFEPLSFQSGGLREERAERVQKLTEQYALNLEHYAKRAPYNWFNFHDFWNNQP